MESLFELVDGGTILETVRTEIGSLAEIEEFLPEVGMGIAKEPDGTNAGIGAEPATVTCARFVDRGEESCLAAHLLCHCFGDAVLRQERYLVGFKACEAFGFVGSDADILGNGGEGRGS